MKCISQTVLGTTKRYGSKVVEREVMYKKAHKS